MRKEFKELRENKFKHLESEFEALKEHKLSGFEKEVK